MFPSDESTTPAPRFTEAPVTPEAPAATPATTATPEATARPALTPIVRGTPHATKTAHDDVAPVKDKALVHVTSKPAGFEILVDGAATGKKTPATVQLDPGPHVLSLKAAGYRPWEFPDEFKAGDTLELPADLVPIPPPE